MNYRFSTFEDVSELSSAIRMTKGYRRAKSNYFFRAESFFNVASKAEYYRDTTPKELYYKRYGGKSLHEQSHGESFLAYFQSFDREGLYLMDEPEAALVAAETTDVIYTDCRKWRKKGHSLSLRPILLFCWGFRG